MSVKFGVTWGADLTDRMLALWREGKSATLIGYEIGRSRNSVIGKLNRMGLHRGKDSRAERVNTPKTMVARSYAPKRTARFALKPVHVRAPEPVYDPPPEGGVTLLELEDGMCKWMLTSQHYCGGGTPHRKPYCPKHAELAKRGSQQ